MDALKPVLLVALICIISSVTPGNSQLCSDSVDLTIIIDSSEDVSASDFDLIKEFLHELIDGDHIEIKFSATRVNYLQYASTLVPSGDHITSSRRAQTTVSDMVYLGGTSRDTAGALDYYVDNHLNSDRSDKQNVVILVITGPSTDKASAIASAETIHNRGDDILVVGVTSAVDEDEIKRLTSSPRVKGQNYFQVAGFTELDGMADSVANGLCNRDTPAPATTTTTAAPTTTTTTTTPSPEPDTTTTPSQKTSTPPTQATPQPSSGRPVVTLTYIIESTEVTTLMTTTTEVPPMSTVLLIAIVVPVLIVLMIIIAVIICCCRGSACCDTEVGCVCGQIHCTEGGATCVTSCCGSCCWIKERTQKGEKNLQFSSLKSSEDRDDAVTTALNPEKT